MLAETQLLQLVSVRYVTIFRHFAVQLMLTRKNVEQHDNSAEAGYSASEPYFHDTLCLCLGHALFNGTGLCNIFGWRHFFVAGICPMWWQTDTQ